MLSAFERLDNEDDIADRLESWGCPESQRLAEPFADVGFTKDDIEIINDIAGGESFPDILRWLENILDSRRLLIDLGEASGRISNLVGAIKSHVQTDKSAESAAHLHRRAAGYCMARWRSAARCPRFYPHRHGTDER